MPAPKPTVEAQVVNAISKLVSEMAKSTPDAKDKMGRIYGETLIWDTIYRMSGNKSESMWDKIKAENMIETAKLTEGEAVLCESHTFQVKAKTSKPYNKFDRDAAATAIADGCKVPVFKVKEFMEKGNVEGNRRTTLNVVQRNV